MIKLLKMQKNKGRQILSLSKGFTYVELIVVLAIFAVMSSIVLFNYGEFQAKVDIKSWVSDIALKIVEAQKSAMSGKQVTGSPTDWKPAYGVYFDTADSKNLIYFADIDGSPGYNFGDVPDIVNITKNIFIYKIEKCTGEPCPLNSPEINPLSITFKRPDSSAVFTGSGGLLYDPNNLSTGLFAYIQITIKSPRSTTVMAKIKIYPSGRVQVN